MSGPVGLILLAAGGSRRLGQPKQLLPVRGVPLLRHAATTALASRCRPVIVVLGAAAASCTRALDGLQVTIAINERWADGMAGSIHRGLDALAANFPDVAGVVLSVCDQPFLSAAVLDSLLETRERTGAAMIAADYAGQPGVPAFFAASLFPNLRELRGDEGARALLRHDPAAVARVDFPAGHTDVDTAADFARLSP